MKYFKYFIVAFLLTTTLALAHSWYPPECCSDSDCRPIACEDITYNEDGSATYKGMVFSKAQIKISKDYDCHACYTAYNAYCLFHFEGA